jgi:hypothetical protein
MPRLAILDHGIGKLPGSELTHETNPLSFPNRSVVLRGRKPRWKYPDRCSNTTPHFLKLFHFIQTL